MLLLALVVVPVVAVVVLAVVVDLRRGQRYELTGLQPGRAVDGHRDARAAATVDCLISSESWRNR